MTNVIYNAYRSLGVRCSFKVKDPDLENAKLVLAGLLFAHLCARLDANTMPSGMLKVDQAKLAQCAFAQSEEPHERVWWKQLFLEAVKNDFLFAPERLHQLIQNEAIRWEIESPWRFKFAKAVRHLEADETVEGWVYYDQDTRSHRVVRPDREDDLVELWSQIDSDDELTAADSLRRWRAKMNHPAFALKVWVENQPSEFDCSALYLDRAGVACTAIGSGDLVILARFRLTHRSSWRCDPVLISRVPWGWYKNSTVRRFLQAPTIGMCVAC